jgi:DNA (cytosine-5)-methyltransferase 1
MTEPLAVLDLFSGIGGFSLGLERAGMHTIAFCEREPFARRVLAKHWPETPIYEDVRTLDPEQFVGAVDVVCGGFPCQPFSSAGKQLGASDDRFLWPEMLRIAEGCRPRFILAENVAGLVNMELDRCLSDLESIGYAAGAIVIPACAVGAPHRRDRVWILGDAYGDRKPGVSVDAEASGRPPLVRDTHSFGRERVSKPRDRYPARGAVDERRATARAAGTRRRAWDRKPGIHRMVDGVSDRLDRTRALGNAVVPDVVEEIGLAMVAIAELEA